MQKMDVENSKSFYQHAIQFKNAADELRRNSFCVQVYDYCTGISYELILKAILCIRGMFTKKDKVHNFTHLLDKCYIHINEREKEYLDYIDLILNKFGRYPVLSIEDREKLDNAVKSSYIINNRVMITNKKSVLCDDTYEIIWNKLINEYKKDFNNYIQKHI